MAGGKWIALWSVGGKGARVSVCAKEGQEERFFIRWYDRQRKAWAYEKSTQPGLDGAKMVAERLSAEMLLAKGESEEAPYATVSYIFLQYEKTKTKAKTPAQQKHDAALMERWKRYLGRMNPADIDNAVLDEYCLRRSEGRLEKHLGPVKGRQIEIDIRWLSTVFRWASRVRFEAGAKGQMLIARNPVDGYGNKLLEYTQKRPVATWEWYESVLEHAREVDPQGLLPHLMTLAVETGQRVSALCGLRAYDVDLERGQVYFDPSLDKENIEHWIPITEGAEAAFRALLKRDGGRFGAALLFPSPGDDEKPWDRNFAQKMHKKAQYRAGAGHRLGDDGVCSRCGEMVEIKWPYAHKLYTACRRYPYAWFHAYRRQFATERKHFNAKDVAAAGGWKSVRSVERYTHVDEATIKSVIFNPVRLNSVRNRIEPLRPRRDAEL